MHSKPLEIKNYSYLELTDWLAENRVDAYRAGQIFRWIYTRQADSFEQMTDISKTVRAKLNGFFCNERLAKVRSDYSRDGACKYLFRLADGHHIESVLIPDKNHFTLCISSQVGCAQNCRFCFTARGGLIRNLTVAEILSQIRDIARDLNGNQRLTNIVFMGMGEPLANYRNLIKALHIITDRDVGLNFSHRRVTVSTAGLVPRLLDLGNQTRVSLAISLNAADNQTRNRLMPINRVYPLEQLLEACRQYPLEHRQKITFEYVLIKGVNDSQQDAQRLAKLLRPIKSKINLIPFNAHPGCPFTCPPESAVLQFQQILRNYRYTTTIRKSKGADIAAACGQLSAAVNRNNHQS